jgi:short-subunit dehydrogenase
VNVWGVIHGVRTFVPILLEQDVPGHIVNTASMAALTAMPLAAAYHMSKHAVLAYSECLYHELAMKGGKIGVSVLCPELIATRIGESERNRPTDLDGADTRPSSPERQLVEKAIREGTAAGLSPSLMADRVVVAIREQRFYILADDAWRDCCNTRLDDIREGRNPTFAPPI